MLDSLLQQFFILFWQLQQLEVYTIYIKKDGLQLKEREFEIKRKCRKKTIWIVFMVEEEIINKANHNSNNNKCRARTKYK
ncbi:unnamed protein product [Meloidogyne enterolobii]|uniref:Uncharacterized protein n=1 Tax=Meloidogyne enterolobii TaxID=390850 RepID=A0ACB1ANY0_MELEN